jgi:glycosyltransferase involved in cell wall biosynthesis
MSVATSSNRSCAASAVLAQGPVAPHDRPDDSPLAQLDARAPLRLLYAGPISRDSGIFEVVLGVRLALTRKVRTRLVIAGDGPDQIALARLIDSLYLARDAVLVDPVSGRARLKLLRGEDASVLPCCTDGLPDGLLDSLAAGVPVIAARAGTIADVVVEGLNGLLVKPRDARDFCRVLCELATNRALLARMREACHKWGAPAGGRPLVPLASIS